MLRPSWVGLAVVNCHKLWKEHSAQFSMTACLMCVRVCACVFVRVCPSLPHNFAACFSEYLHNISQCGNYNLHFHLQMSKWKHFFIFTLFSYLIVVNSRCIVNWLLRNLYAQRNCMQTLPTAFFFFLLLQVRQRRKEIEIPETGSQAGLSSKMMRRQWRPKVFRLFRPLRLLPHEKKEPLHQKL